jgi:hypothetical protein
MSIGEPLGFVFDTFENAGSPLVFGAGPTAEHIVSGLAIFRNWGGELIRAHSRSCSKDIQVGRLLIERERTYVIR